MALLAETGIIGFALLLIPMYAIARTLLAVWRLARDTPYQEMAMRMVIPFAAWLVFTVHNRVWRDRAFWVAVITIYGLYAVVRQYRAQWGYRSSGTGRS